MFKSGMSPLRELLRRRKPVRNANIESREKLTTLDRLAVWITERVGTMGFFLCILAWTMLWLGWNIFAPMAYRFDPYPAFVLWLFISNMIQILLMPLLLVGQNLQGRHAEARAEADFEINTQAEQEVEAILLQLERHGDLLAHLVEHADRENRVR